jgi:hypothetical protein
MDIRRVQFLIRYIFDTFLFMCLCHIVLFYCLFHTHMDLFDHALYSFVNAMFIKFQTTFGNVCSNLTDQSCSIPMNINPYFFPTKLALIYFSLVDIAMIYTWHQAVRLSHCIFTLIVIIIIIFGTDLVLISNIIMFHGYSLCCTLILSFTVLNGIYVPGNIEATLYILYQPDMSLNDWYTRLQNETSMCARFCRWIKRTQKRWNMEEKLILTTIVGLTTCISTIILMFIFDLLDHF